jgi:hypothetical protein
MTVRSYHDTEVHLALELPAEWEAGSTPDFALFLTAPEEQGFQANFSFTISPFDPPTHERLLEFIRDTRLERAEIFQGFALVNEERMIQDQCPGYIETYHWTMDNGVPIFQVFALILLGPDALYTMHGTCLRALEHTYEPQFRQIIKSIRFLRAET